MRILTLKNFSRNTRLEKHIPLGAPPNPGGFGTLPAPAAGAAPITGNTFAGGAAGPAVTPANAQGLQGAFGLQYFDTLLSSAQILALFTTAVPLVPAPGVGFFINPVYIKMILLAGSAAYLDGGGGAVTFAVGSLSVPLASNAEFLVTVSPNRRIQVVDWAAAALGTGVTGTAGNPPTEDNAAFTIAKATANFTAGNGTMKITVYYTIEPTL